MRRKLNQFHEVICLWALNIILVLRLTLYNVYFFNGFLLNKYFFCYLDLNKQTICIYFLHFKVVKVKK